VAWRRITEYIEGKPTIAPLGLTKMGSRSHFDLHHRSFTFLSLTRCACEIMKMLAHGRNPYPVSSFPVFRALYRDGVCCQALRYLYHLYVQTMVKDLFV